MAKIDSIFKKDSIQKADGHPKRITKWIHYTKLKTNKYQYCDAKDKEELEALADLIEADGEVLQDVLIRKTDADEYEIIAGHKRKQACQILVEERGKEQYAFIPCIVKDISDVRAEFQVYSSNGHHEETPYETTYKLERMKYLLETYPEEFPDFQSGRMVERLAKMYNMKKTTVGEYQKIAKNLGETAMEAFRNGEIDKSAAVTLAGMAEAEQNHVIEQGISKDVEIKQYIQKNLEPDRDEIVALYNIFSIHKCDMADRKALVRKIRDKEKHAGHFGGEIDCRCSPTQIEINPHSESPKKITWNRFAGLLDQYIPYTAKEEKTEEPIPGQMEITSINMEMEEAGDASLRELPEQEESSKKDTNTEASPKHPIYIRVSREEYKRLTDGKPYLILEKNVQIQDILIVQMFENDRACGDSMSVRVDWIDTKDTIKAIAEGYCVAGIKMVR